MGCLVMKGVVADNSTPTTRIQTPPVTAPAEVTDKVAWVCHKDRDQVASSPNCIPRLRLIHRRIHLNLHRGTAVQGGRRNRKEGQRRLEGGDQEQENKQGCRFHTWRLPCQTPLSR